MTQTKISHENILKRFVALDQKGHLGHAYLFVGMTGVGKSTAALNVAKTLTCEERVGSDLFCGKCPACQKITSGTHPDIHLVEKDKPESISIERIRRVISEIQLKPFMAKWKVFIIKDADLLTTDAANALLKTLEEPPAQSLLILTTSAAQKNLETIRSRCQTICFPSLTPAEIQDALKDEKVSTVEAHFLSLYSGGSLGKAKSLNKQKAFEQKNKIIDRFVVRDDSTALFKESLSSKEGTRFLLDVLSSWIRDCCLLKTEIDQKQLIHRDRLTDLRQFSGRFSLDELKHIHDEIMNTYQLSTENFNVKVPLIIIKELVWVKSLK